MLCKSDPRLSANTYRELLTQILQHCFAETTQKCRAVALHKHLQHSARYITHEYAQQQNNTIELQLTNMNAAEEKTEFAEVIEKRVSKLKKKIKKKKFEKALRIAEKRKQRVSKHSSAKQALHKAKAVKIYTDAEKQAYLSA